MERVCVLLNCLLRSILINQRDPDLQIQRHALRSNLQLRRLNVKDYLLAGLKQHCRDLDVLEVLMRQIDKVAEVIYVLFRGRLHLSAVYVVYQLAYLSYI